MASPQKRSSRSLDWLEAGRSLSVRVKVNLFANLRQYAPGGKDCFNLELSPEANASQLVQTLGIPPNAQLVILVNGRQAQEETSLTDGDTVTLFPPMAGG